MSSDAARKSGSENLRQARTVFWQTLFLNLIVSASKLVCGFKTGTLSMVADGFHSLMDASSNIVGILGLTISIEPADRGHPYGHRKFEALAAIGISFLMFLAGSEVVKEVFNRITAPESTTLKVEPISYAVMIASIVISILVSKYEKSKAETLGSNLLAADAQHTMSDVYASLGVIAALLAAQMKINVIDLVASVVIVIAIFKAGYGIITANMGILVDAVVLDESEVEAIVCQVEGVISCHKVRSRGMKDHIFLDLHVQVPGHISVEEGHQIAYAVEERLKERLDGVVDVVVHIEDPHE
ncbi:MAG: cation transporter [Cyanobacteria bacterium HKST-UBA02]|nr:cation transporter [Cyanobacteria bacterium HKST-UBA02]